MKVTATLFLTLLSLTAQAQTFEQLTFLRLSEAPMSVRGAAMGAVSDDDISVNPASLATFDRPSFSIAGARTSYSRDVFLVLTPELAVSEHRTLNPTALSHAMFAVPVGAFTVGAWYRAEPELGSSLPSASVAGSPFVPSVCPLEPCVRVNLYGVGSLERQDVRYGAALSWESGPLAFGAGAEVQDLDESADFLRTRFTAEPAIFDRVLMRTEGREIVPHAGIRWSVSPRLAVAASYKGAGTFRRTRSACLSGGVGVGCASDLALEDESTQKMPDSYRLSVSLQPVERLQLVAEAVRRNYSNLATAVELDGFAVAESFRDATELHAGAEYRLGTIALRGGWWRDPARHVDVGVEPVYEFSRRRDHITVGAGVNVGPARVDLALDDADDPALRRASVGLRFATR